MITLAVLTVAFAAGSFSALAMPWVFLEWRRRAMHAPPPVPRLAWWLSALFGLSWAIVYVLQVAP